MCKNNNKVGNCCYLLIVNIHTHDMLVSEEKIYITPHDFHNSPSQVVCGDTNISQKCRQSMVHRWHAGKLQIYFTFYHRLLVFISWWLRWQRICLQCRRSRFDPWVGKILGKGNIYPLQYSCLENSMDSGAWWATIHGVTKNHGHNWTTDTFILRLGKSKKFQDTRDCIPFALRQEVVFIEAINEKDWVWKIGATRDKE